MRRSNKTAFARVINTHDCLLTKKKIKNVKKYILISQTRLFQIKWYFCWVEHINPMFHRGSSFNLEAKLSLNALAGTTAVILVSKKKKSIVPVNRLFEIYLDGTIHTKKACEQHCLFAVETNNLPLLLRRWYKDLWGKVPGASLSTRCDAGNK